MPHDLPGGHEVRSILKVCADHSLEGIHVGTGRGAFRPDGLESSARNPRRRRAKQEHDRNVVSVTRHDGIATIDGQGESQARTGGGTRRLAIGAKHTPLSVGKSDECSPDRFRAQAIFTVVHQPGDRDSPPTY